MGSITQLKNSLLFELNSYDILREVRLSTSEELAKEEGLHSNLVSILHQEELYWKQHSRITWLKEEDANKRFFHAVANGCRNCNLMSRISSGKDWVEGDIATGAAFTDYFRYISRIMCDFCFQINWSRLFARKKALDLSMVEAQFSLA